ncbi:hypothetical protein BVRB_2g042190 [Beta vulgaris subsp. vulgaris]|nr:hypothetical protein BVRB_2g042190 [Beta vulgaris subsp. vulgaris]
MKPLCVGVPIILHLLHVASFLNPFSLSHILSTLGFPPNIFLSPQSSHHHS